ncbi:hypothetical protein L0663_00005, partial [Dyadobacter sp. CY107]|uniref:hypothetical protein n=1 Tax=Dyadobacter fanqingshengii TaxID=2906443 RepID=UPI001F27E5C9
MKQHYKTGVYIIFFLILSVAYVVKMRELNSGKSKPNRLTPLKSNSKEQPSIVPDSTISSIQHSLAKREYNISFDTEKNTLQSPNRKQGLRAYYKPGE